MCGEQACGCDHLRQYGPGAHQRDAGCVWRQACIRCGKAVAASQERGLHTGGQIGLGVVFVHQGDVVENVLLVHQHLAHALVDDHRHLARKRRVVGFAVGDGGRHQMAAAVLVLQAFATQRRAARCGTQEKAPGALIGRRPDGVAHTLKAEHGVINIKGQHRQAVHAVAGGCSGPAGNRAGFADAFFQNLPVHGFAVAQHRADVFGLVLLADAGVNAHLFEQIGHAEGARLVRHDGHHARPEHRVFQQLPQHAHKGHGGRHLFAIGLQRKAGVGLQRGHGNWRAGGVAAWQVAAQGLAPGVQVLHFRAVICGFEEIQLGGLLVAQGQVKAVAKGEQGGLIQLFLAVRGHLALTGLAHAVALFGVRQDHGGLAAVLGRCRVGGMDLHQVVAAAFEAVNLRIRQTLRQGREFGVLAEEVLAVEAPVFGGKGLHLAVHRVGKRAHQRAAGVAGKQAVPVAAPDEFNHVPAGATKQFFQLVNDAAIAPHRPVQPLQIAVDHPHQVVQFFARGQGERAHAFGLVHFAVTEHAPDLAAGAVQQAAVCEEAHEAGVVNRADGPQTHGAGGELPEVGHQPRVRVAREAARAFAWGFEFLAVQR